MAERKKIIWGLIADKQLIDENSQVYILSDEQVNLVKEAQEEFKNGDYLNKSLNFNAYFL